MPPPIPTVPPIPHSPHAPAPISLLYLVVGGQVLALLPANGQEVWRTKIKNALTGVVSLIVKDGIVYAGVAGVVHCIDGLTGTTLWTNELKGLGYGHVFVAMEGATTDSSASAAAIEAQKSSD